MLTKPASLVLLIAFLVSPCVQAELWLGTSDRSALLDDSPLAVKEIHQNTATQLAADGSEHYWLYRDNTLHYVTRSGEQLLEHALPNAYSHNTRLAVVEAGVAVLHGENIYLISREGQQLTSVSLGEPGNDMASRGNTLWVSTDKQVLSIDTTQTNPSPVVVITGNWLDSFNLLAIHSETGDIWVSNRWRVERYSAAGVKQSSTLMALATVRHLAVTPDNNAWVAGYQQLVKLDSAGQVVSSHWPLSDWLGTNIKDMQPTADGDALWLAGKEELLEIDASGEVTQRQSLGALLPKGEASGWSWWSTPETIQALSVITAGPLADDIDITQPETGAALSLKRPNLEIEVIGGEPADVVDHMRLQSDSQSWPLTCDPLESSLSCTPDSDLVEGQVEYRAILQDDSGEVVAESEPVVWTVDTVAPVLTVAIPQDGSYKNSTPLEVTGEVSEAATVTVNDELALVDAYGIFRHEVALSEGVNQLITTATDTAGNQARDDRSVYLDTQAPEGVVLQDADIQWQESEETVQFDLQLDSEEAGGQLVVTNETTGTRRLFEIGADGRVSGDIHGEQGDALNFRVEDQAGNVSEPQTWDVGLPVDPALVAPEIEPGSKPALYDRVAFLFDGTSGVQQGTELGAIEPERVNVIRGHVKDAATDAALAGVTVSVRYQDEVGYTVSRRNGDYDLAFNGGGRVIVEYQKEDYLSVQRVLNTRWEEWNEIKPVALMPLSDRVTTIELGRQAQSGQLAMGDVIEDDDGRRQATVFFPQGLTAQLEHSDGTVETLDQLNVRATEYTVGDNGPAAMPGPLPAETAYTYAIELSADEALQGQVAGATNTAKVSFSQPVSFYVDNFLDFPVGEAVPLGFYDGTAAQWIPKPDGRIIEILGTSGGLATVDVNGDGQAATQQVLQDHGFSEEELARLADTYEAGDTLWRVQMSHFSSWDCNWPYGPPNKSRGSEEGSPNQNDNNDCRGGAGNGESCQKPTCEKQDNKTGCIISPHKRSLSEKIPLQGSGFEWHYQSQQQKGYREKYTLEIPLTGDEVPEKLKEAFAIVKVAGRRIKVSAGTDANVTRRFEWDGRDAWGRKAYGAHPVSVSVVYEYPCVYYGTDSESGTGNNFGRYGGLANPIGTRDRCEGFQFSQDYDEIYTLQSPWGDGSRVAGNWMLSAYMPSDVRSFYANDGALTREITTLNGRSTYYEPGITMSDLKVYRPKGLTAAPDGSYLFIDALKKQVLSVSRDGEVTLLAGGGDQDALGIPATEFAFPSANDLALADDGSIYVVSRTAHAVYKINSEGIITLFAGGNGGGYSGDRGSANEASFQWPTRITIDSAGNFYVLDSGNRVVRRVGRDGIITTIAGNGGIGSVSGWPAEESVDSDALALPSLSDVLATNDGLYLLSFQGLLFVNQSGEGRRVAGGGNETPGDLPLQALQVDFDNLRAMARDKSALYLMDSENLYTYTPDGFITAVNAERKGKLSISIGGNRDRNLELPSTDSMVVHSMVVMPNNDLLVGLHYPYLFGSPSYIHKVSTSGINGAIINAEGEVVLPSGDATKLYGLSRDGRHLYTQDARTGEYLYRFEHNAEGELISIKDRHDNITRFQHGSGQIELTSPDGQRTVMALSSEGWLQSVEQPGNIRWQMDYQEGGLMTRFLDPNNHSNQFAYDDQGYLVSDVNAEGGGWTITTNDGENTLNTEMVTAMGVVHSFTRETLGDGAFLYQKTYPGGGQQIRDVRKAGRSVITSRNGTLAEFFTKADESYGNSAPLQVSTTIRTPSGLEKSITRDRHLSLKQEGELLLDSSQEARTINGKTYSQSYSDEAGEYTTTTPEGRSVVRGLNEKGLLESVAVPDIEPVEYSYQADGRLSTMAQGEGIQRREVQLQYHNSGSAKGYLASATDALGRSTDYTYDEAGRVTILSLPGNREVHYDYDAKGNLTRLTPPGKTAHVFHYDGVDQETRYTPPSPSTGEGQGEGDTYATHYQYNLDKQLTQVTRPDGQQVQLQYGATTGNLDGVQTPRGTYSYTYNPNTGQLSSVTSPDSVTVQTVYDGFLVTAQNWSGLVSGSVSWDYNNDFLPTQSQVNSGQAITYGYDNDSLLTQAGNLSISRSASNGLITGTTLADITTSRQYNGFGEIETAAASLAGEGDLYQASYTRDQLGRITQKTESINGQSASVIYDYDTAGRLQTVTRNGETTRYSYDANGNRLSKTGPSGTVTGQYDAQDRLTQYGNNTYEYNANGDLTTKRHSRESGGLPDLVTEYEYDVFGNLVSATVPSPLAGEGQGEGPVEIDYLTDGQNRRVGKILNGTRVQGFLYKDQLNPVAELDGQGNVVSRFVYGDKGNIPSYMVKGGQSYRIISDHLGSPRMVINTADGTIEQEMNYDAFGNITKDTNPGFQPFGFAGGIYDQHTKLTRFGARDYDAETGRWTTKDPIRFDGGLNLFGYVGSDVVNFYDPTGLYWYRQSWQKPGVVGRDGTPVPPGGAVSEFMETKVPAGYTFGELHDGFVDIATKNGVPDEIANIPSMLPTFFISQWLEVLRSLELLPQPVPVCE